MAILDQSEGLAETNVYTSDFSVNENGFSGGLTTLLGNQDGISDGVW